jgi:hypothetical protein
MYSHVNKDIRFDEEIEIDKKKNNGNKSIKNNVIDQSSDTDTDISINSPLNNKIVLKKSANPLLSLSDNNNFTVDDETEKMDEAFSSVDSKCDLLLNSNSNSISNNLGVPGITIDQIQEEPNIHILIQEEEIKKEETIVVEEPESKKKEENQENEEKNKSPEEIQFFGFKPFE